MSTQPENEQTDAEDEGSAPPAEDSVAPDLTGVGPREDDETVSAEDLIELKDDPEPMEPSD